MARQNFVVDEYNDNMNGSKIGAISFSNFEAFYQNDDRCRGAGKTYFVTQ